MSLQAACGTVALDGAPTGSRPTSPQLYGPTCLRSERLRRRRCRLPDDLAVFRTLERRPATLRAADAAVAVLRGGPVPRQNVATEFAELVLGFLIEGADAAVERGAHANLSARWWRAGSSGSR